MEDQSRRNRNGVVIPNYNELKEQLRKLSVGHRNKGDKNLMTTVKRKKHGSGKCNKARCRRASRQIGFKPAKR